MTGVISEAAWREAYSGQTEVGYLYYDSQSDPSNTGWVARWHQDGPESIRGDDPLESDIAEDELDVAEAAVPDDYETVWVCHPDGTRGHIYPLP